MMITERTVTDSELLETARLSSERFLSDPRMAHLPRWSLSPQALVCLLSAVNPRPHLVEQARQQHLDAEHGGVHSTECEACGYFDAAVYYARTGRDLSVDFLGKPVVAEQAPK